MSPERSVTYISEQTHTEGSACSNALMLLVAQAYALRESGPASAAVGRHAERVGFRLRGGRRSSSARLWCACQLSGTAVMDRQGAGLLAAAYFLKWRSPRTVNGHVRR